MSLHGDSASRLSKCPPCPPLVFRVACHIRLVALSACFQWQHCLAPSTSLRHILLHICCLLCAVPRRPVQDSNCSQLLEGRRVTCFYRASNTDSKYYDAVVLRADRQTHGCGKERGSGLWLQRVRFVGWKGMAASLYKALTHDRPIFQSPTDDAMTVAQLAV